MCGAIGNLKKVDMDKWDEFIEEFDENKDRQIDYDEFKKMMLCFHDHFGGEDETMDEEELSSPNQRLQKAIMEESSDAYSNDQQLLQTKNM